jgi:hypothetical protein
MVRGRRSPSADGRGRATVRRQGGLKSALRLVTFELVGGLAILLNLGVVGSLRLFAMPDPYSYVAFIDESGDDGISRVSPIDPNGASEWFILAAVVVRAERQTETVGWVKNILADLKSPQRRHLHFQPLESQRKAKVCAAIAKLPLRCFVFASNKKNMRGYRNPRAEKIYSPARNWFYWWSTRLLLERVTEYCERRSIRDHQEPRKVRLEFSRRGGLYYSHFRVYLDWLKTQSRAEMLYISQGDLRWSVVDTKQVHAFDHTERAGLQIADAVAGAFFQGVTIDQWGACQPHYAISLEPRMAFDAHNRVYGYGFKLMPTNFAWRADPRQRPVIDFYRELKKGRQAPGP